jgi:hypothetical protein
MMSEATPTYVSVVVFEEATTCLHTEKVQADCQKGDNEEPFWVSAKQEEDTNVSVKTDMLVGYVCMYIVGEGLKRP